MGNLVLSYRLLLSSGTKLVSKPCVCVWWEGKVVGGVGLRVIPSIQLCVCVCVCVFFPLLSIGYSPRITASKDGQRAEFCVALRKEILSLNIVL